MQPKLAKAPNAEAVLGERQLQAVWRTIRLGYLTFYHTFIFLETFRGMPTANAEGWIKSEATIGKVSARRVFRPPFRPGAGPRRSPSACSEILKKITSGIVRDSVGLFYFVSHIFLTFRFGHKTGNS